MRLIRRLAILAPLFLLTLPAAWAGGPSRGTASIESIARQELEASMAQDLSEVSPTTAEPAFAGARWGLEATAFRCLPSCATNDGRFLAVAAGASLVTLSESSLEVQVAVPAGVGSFQLGIFDGDADAANTNWDVGAAPFDYTVFADPTRDGLGMTVAAGPFSSSSLPNNAWFDFTITTDSAAQAPSGNFFYRLRIENLDPSLVVLNSFKLRTDGVVSIEVQQQPFGFYAALQSQQDALIIFPSFPASATPTTYDGSFDFFIDVASAEDDLILWGGDLDRGSYNGLDLDTDDPDTPGAPFLPPWATADAVPEGVAVGLPGTTGNPADDTNPAGLGVFLMRSPAIEFSVIAPDGGVYLNPNPSGNQEWEKFQLTTIGPLDPTVADQLVPALPAGVYQIRAEGVDMQNLNFWRFFYPLLCVDEADLPCQPLRSFLVGDQVWLDLDGNGLFDTGEPGIPGVVLELLDADGDVIATTTTDVDGLYSFGVDAGTFGVRIAASNFDPGNALAGLALSSSSDELSTTIIDANDLTLDFGYRGFGEIGDRLWLDLNADGFQDPGEPGLEGVTVILRDDGGAVITTTVTGPDGFYLFEGLIDGLYQVEVDASTLPPGVNPTYDFDGVGTPNLVVDIELNVGDGGSSSNLFIDFGYAGTGAIGDRVWEDLNGNGVQDPGEPGLIGVVVYLYDGDGNQLAIAFTGFDGIYSFENLLAGTYRVDVEPVTIPGGLLPTFDFDGTATPNSATVILGDGEINNAVDFGYGTPSLDGSIGDRVWLDLDGDGVQDGGEPGIVGATVRLLDAGGNVVGTTTTGVDGIYGFGGLAAGVYTVVVDPTTTGQAVIQTYDLDGIDSPHRAQVAVASGEDRTDLDFGYTDRREICADEAQKTGDTHAIWLPGIGTQFYFEPAAVFTENADGSATLTGTAVDATNPARIFYVQATLTGRTAVTPPGSPKKELPAGDYVENGGPIDPSTWYYYTGLTGTLVGDGDLEGAVLTIERVGPAWQVGFGANNKNHLYGASSWFTWIVMSQPDSGDTLPNGQGDFNLELIDCVTSTTCLPVLDFDEDAFGDKLARGTLIGEQWAALGIHITTNNPVNRPLMIFDSSNPTGGDWDLGTPNQDFGGPGVGTGGQAGAPGENRYPLGNLLIISEDGDQNDPDDNAGGGTIIFTFDQPVDVESVKLVDIDINEPAAVRAYDGAGLLIAQAGMLNRGNNSVQDVLLGATGVRRLEVTFPGSGAIADVVFCKEEEPPVECGQCSGKVTELTLQYQGHSTARVKVYNSSGSVRLFSGYVSPGGQLTVYGYTSSGTLGSEIKIYVNGYFHTKIDTSCYHDVGPGFIAGSFMVVAGESRYGGPLCPIGGPLSGDPSPWAK